ncbi:MAG: dethiobiotin synthase [Phycisphaerales bacterium]|nr:dethiobiotin synthase [Phycisphaerales bacterium]
MLSPCPLPGLFVTGTDTGVGKTIVAAALANWFDRRGALVGVCKPIATGCAHRREGLVSEDAELLAHCANTRQPLDIVCPQRYAEPLAPAVAAKRANQPVDWTVVQRSMDLITQESDRMIIEGVGGVLVPLDDRNTVLDLMAWLDIPAVVVARAALGTINHTLLTLQALRKNGIRIAGVVINGYPAESPGIAEETNPHIIERWGKTKILCILPQVQQLQMPHLPADIIGTMDSVDWESLASRGPIA